MTPTPEKVEDQRKLMPLDKILTFERLQIRGAIDPSRVEQYREIMRNNGTDGAVGYMDPIMVYYETSDGPKWIADGSHRIESAQAEQAAKMPVILRQGSRSKALRYALGENGHHGAPMTNAEKRHAAEVAVLDAELGKLKDIDIAKLVGCSPSLVSDCRRGETPAAKTEKAKKRAAKKKDPEPEAPSEGKRETESPAPRSATARERTPVDNRPTKAQILRQIQDYLTNDVVDEADILKLMEAKEEEYRWVTKPGGKCNLRVVGKSGRVQAECEVVIREVGPQEIVLRYEGEGKLVLQEAQ